MPIVFGFSGFVWIPVPAFAGTGFQGSVSVRGTLSGEGGTGEPKISTAIHIKNFGVS